MSEVPESNIRKFQESSNESWWHCKSPDCNCAYQKSDCLEPGVCPYCGEEGFNNEPWEWFVLNNPQFPRVPESGRTYTQKIV